MDERPGFVPTGLLNHLKNIVCGYICTQVTEVRSGPSSSWGQTALEKRMSPLERRPRNTATSSRCNIVLAKKILHKSFKIRFRLLLSKFDFVGSYDNLTLNIVSALKVAIDWARDTDLDFVTV